MSFQNDFHRIIRSIRIIRVLNRLIQALVADANR